MMDPTRSTGSDGDSASAPRENELRLEIDRLRLEKHKLVTEREDASRPLGWALRGIRGIWRAAWHRYYVARWHLLHVRDPHRRLKLRERYEPYRLRIRRTPQLGRPRILHVIGNFYTGGSAQLVVDLIEHLGHRFEQRVLVRSLPPRPAYSGLDFIHRPRLRGPGQLSSVLQQFGPDIVHVHMLGHQHDDYGKSDWSWYHSVFRAAEHHRCRIIENLNIPVEPYISRAVCCYVHVSDYVKKRFGRLDTWNETIYPGSDLEHFSREANMPVVDDCIGMVYRMQPDKLNEQSIEPFIRVVSRRPRTTAHIVGGGQLLEVYQRRVADAGMLDAFTFTGFVSYIELPHHISKMGVFVAPVHTESFGQVSAFAMGMEIPVVGYRVGALEEITRAPELLASPGDTEQLANIIIELLDDRERRMRIGHDNRRRALDVFSVEAMAARYEALYNEVLSATDSHRSGAERASRDF